jgi:hypothetical protein
VKTEHPWQAVPTELIRYALIHLHRPSDFDQRVAFLLLDVGVETLLKVYLLHVPERVSGTTMSYNARKKAAEGYFHELLKGVQEAAGDRMDGVDLDHVQYFHNIRNQLYHEGDGVSVSADKAREYASVAVKLLQRLLSVDLEELRDPPPLIVIGAARTEVVPAGVQQCPLCKNLVEIPDDLTLVRSETREPVCWECGERYADSGLAELLLTYYLVAMDDDDFTYIPTEAWSNYGW